ncbi:MAG: choice-of-anchor J domain-containing protein [Flavobacteriales bacterium]
MKRTLTFFLFLFLIAPVARSQVVFSSNFDALGNIVEKKFFSDSSVISGGWDTISVTGPQGWNIGDFTGSNPYAEINGYDSSATENEDWLVSPALDGTQGLYLGFMNAKNYSGPDLKLLVSTDYTGSGTPGAATWDTLNFDRSSGSYNWVHSGSVDLTAYSDPDIYIAFVYNSSSTSSAHWEIDDIRISSMAIPWFGSKTNIETDSLSSFTSGVQYGTYGVRMLNQDTAHRRLTTKPLAVDSGQAYDVTYWVRGDGSVRAGLYDGDASDGDFGYTYAAWNNVTSGSTWQMKTQTVTADTTNPDAEFILSVSFTYPSQHSEFDSVVVEKTGGVGISEHRRNEGTLKVFPNPASERFQVRAVGYGRELDVELIDPMGKVVRSRSSGQATRFTFDVSDLSTGVYFLRIRNEEHLEQRKILVR